MQSLSSLRVYGLAAAGLFLGLSATSAASAQNQTDDPNICITHRAEARASGVGFNHLVHVSNGCSKAARCSIVTSANRKPTRLQVPAGSTKTANTYLGSPARQFSAEVTCTLQ